MPKRKSNPNEVFGIRMSAEEKNMLLKIPTIDIRETLAKLASRQNPYEDALRVLHRIENERNEFVFRHGKTIEDVMEEREEELRIQNEVIEKEIEKALKIWETFKWRDSQMEYYLDSAWENDMKLKGIEITFQEARDRTRAKRGMLKVMD